MQCDFDTVGSDRAACDFEILHIMRNTLLAVAGTDVRIHLNHRGIFNRFLSSLGVLEKSVDILRTVDKFAKIGRDETLKLLSEIVGEGEAGKILDFIGIKGNFDDTLAAMTEAAGSSPDSERLGLIGKFMRDAGVADSFVLDPSITRGLDYYTGVVFESFLVEMPGIGSVCSGGRYDNLVGLYSKEPLSGIGASLGIDRLIAALEALGRLETKPSYARVAVACVSESSGGVYQALAEKLRKEGIPCEVFLDGEKLTKQFQAAEKKGIQWLIIPDEKDPLGGALTLRDLKKRENQEGLTVEEIIAFLKNN
jgi:histidyl-tRNA synthetase